MRAKILMRCARSQVQAPRGGNFAIFRLSPPQYQVRFILAGGSTPVAPLQLCKGGRQDRQICHASSWGGEIAMKDENNAVFVPLCCGREEGRGKSDVCAQSTKRRGEGLSRGREQTTHQMVIPNKQSSRDLVATFVDTNH